MADKSTTEMLKITEVFVKEAFCIDGPVVLVHEPVSFKCHFRALDSKRGIIIIGFCSVKE